MSIYFLSKFMKSKYRASISYENLVSELRCVICIKYVLDFRNSTKKNVECFIENSFTLILTGMIIFYIVD